MKKFFGLGLRQSLSYGTGRTNSGAPSRFYSGTLAPIPGDGDGRGAFDFGRRVRGGLLNQRKSPSMPSQMYGLIEVLHSGELSKCFKHQLCEDFGVFLNMLGAPS